MSQHRSSPTHEPPHWHCARPDDLHWHRFDDEPDQWVIFDAGSGDTHQLNNAAAAVLQQLIQKPATASDLVRHLAGQISEDADPGQSSAPSSVQPGESGEEDAAIADFLHQLIQQFDQAGLVQPVTVQGLSNSTAQAAAPCDQADPCDPTVADAPGSIGDDGKAI